MLDSCPMGDESALEDVRKWLEQGGYVLEMLVAREFSARGGMVSQGYHFTDPVTLKEREGDVSGFFVIGPMDPHTHAIQVLAECKNTTAPWVFFIGDSWDNGSWAPTSYFARDCLYCDVIDTEIVALRRRMPNAYAVTQKRHKNDRDHAYEAVQQVTAALLSYYDHDDWEGHPDPVTVSHLGVPLVVTQSPLIACSLDEFGVLQLEHHERIVVHVPRTDLPDAESESIAVIVVKFSGLDSLLEEMGAIENTAIEEAEAEAAAVARNGSASEEAGGARPLT